MKNYYIKYIFVFALMFFLAKISTANSDSICVADFSYEVYEELGKPSVLHFTNLSTGNPTQFSWDFSDGSISTVKDPIHYFPENGTYQVRLIVANNSSSDIITKEIEINVPLSIDFSFKLDSNNIVPNTFLFSGIVDGYYDNIIWNFGDQILQNVEDTIHSYSKEDSDYQVTFTAHYHFNDTSSMTKALAKGLTTSEYFNLGGQVFLDDSIMNNPINQSDTGIAYLFRVDNNQLIPIDTNHFQKLGYYWFDKKLKAHYIVQVSLDNKSTHAGQYAPTYIGNTAYWDEAEIINLAQNKYREDVIMINKNESQAGLKTLSGQVNDLIDANKNEKVLICLFDTENNLIDYQVNNSYSDYEFNNLQMGHYLIGADIPGIYSRPMLIYINDKKENDFKSIDQVSANNIFPNPASGYTLISFQNTMDLSQTELSIYSSDGRLLSIESYNLTSGMNYIHLNLSDLPIGVLYVQIGTTKKEIIKLVHY